MANIYVGRAREPRPEAESKPKRKLNPDQLSALARRGGRASKKKQPQVLPPEPTFRKFNGDPAWMRS